VVVRYALSGGKLRVDDVSVKLMPVGTVIPPRAGEARDVAPVDAALPLPAGPDGFRGGN
jgi:hypothetical protein